MAEPYSFKAIDLSAGKNAFVDGTVEADNIEHAELLLHQRKHIPLRLIRKRTKGGAVSISTRAKSIFLRQMAMCMKVGTNSAVALDLIGRMCRDPHMKKIIGGMHNDVAAGNRFSVAAERYSGIWGTIGLGLFVAGEKSGSLVESMLALSALYEKEHDAKRQLKGLLIYPAVVIVVAAGVIAYFLTAVVPAFASVYEQIGAELPWSTRSVIATTHFLTGNFMPLLAITALLIVLFFFKERIFYARMFPHRLALKLPIAKALLPKIWVAQFIRTFVLLHKKGLANPQVLLHCRSVSNNYVFQSILGQVYRMTVDGAKLTQAFQAADPNRIVFDDIFCGMLRVGEGTGDIDSVLRTLGEYYGQDLEYALDNAKKLIEPALIVAIGLLVFYIVYSLAVPMLRISEYI